MLLLFKLSTLIVLLATIPLGLHIEPFSLSPKTFTIIDGLLAVDAPAYGLIVATSLLFFFASLYLPGFLRAERECAPSAHAHEPTMPVPYLVMCLLLFLCTMLLVLTAQNFGFLWVAVEATTLASAPLIAYHRSPHSIEAMWKYLLICSVGIGFALLGTMCLSLSCHFSDAGGIADLSFNTAANNIHEGWFKAAFIFILAGYGTKTGLAPFHTWLPDAHSESPAVVSALLSGTLLNCAFFGIYRTISITSGALLEFCQTLLIFFGVFSILVAALFIIKQSDFKRMLAYSSVEHMGIIALACGLGCKYAMAIHIGGHTLLKGMLFMLAGNILACYGTRTISRVRGLLTAIPKNAVLWMTGLLAICGTPPSPLFISEFRIVQKAAESGNPFLAITTVVLLFAVFAGMSVAFFNMFFNSKNAVLPPEKNCGIVEKNASVPLILCGIALILGLAISFFVIFEDL